MLVFSQRFADELDRIRLRNRRLVRRYSNDSHIDDNKEKRREYQDTVLNDLLRTRLQSEIVYLIKNGYLERFLTVYDENSETYHIDELELRNLSSREIGYDLNIIIDPVTLSFDVGSYNDINFL